MANFLQRKYVGKYRVIAEYDQETNDYVRDEMGNIDHNYDDLYIQCAYNCKISYMGSGVMQFYCESLRRGKSILNKIKEGNPEAYNKITNIVFTDSEVTFNFKWTLMDDLEKYLKPKTKGASISPFSTKNLPQQPYTIPPKDMERYKKIVESIYDNDYLLVGRITRLFLSDIKYDGLQGEYARRKSCLKIKEFIHNVGKWEEFLKYLTASEVYINDKKNA